MSSLDAIRKSIVVRCDVDTAFRIWTEQVHAWWPKGHTRSGNPDTRVLIEGQIGGRLYEQTPDGFEYDWGKIVAWDPPRHFAYHWYLGSSVEQPTRVDVHFCLDGPGSTRVDVRHQALELIGELWSGNSPRYDTAWEAVLPAYRATCIALASDLV